MIYHCPILKRCPHKEDCHYCSAFDFNNNICQYKPTPFEPTQVMEVRPKYLDKNVSLDNFEQVLGQVLHLEKKVNKHIDSAKQKKAKSKYEYTV